MFAHADKAFGDAQRTIYEGFWLVELGDLMEAVPRLVQGMKLLSRGCDEAQKASMAQLDAAATRMRHACVVQLAGGEEAYNALWRKQSQQAKRNKKSIVRRVLGALLSL